LRNQHPASEFHARAVLKNDGGADGGPV
jgi:hypothetical protein